LPRLLTIPYLANATRPGDLDFAAARCDVTVDGARMDCRFRQVFLTISPIDPQSCLITTNGYEKAFRRESSRQWISVDEPVGECGVTETTVLEDGGGTRWTMTIRSGPTKRADEPRCRSEAQEPLVYSWRGLQRRLSCTSIQPGAIER
jgi:hypothetical protein